MTIRDKFPSIIPAEDDTTTIGRYTAAHEDELGEIEEDLEEIVTRLQLRQIDLYGQVPDSTYTIEYIDLDGNVQTVQKTFDRDTLTIAINEFDEVVRVFNDDREFILDGDYDEWEDGIIWTPTRRNPDFDRISEIFGDLGRRRGRSDREYRRFLNSLVPVLSGRGQVPTLKEAVAISLGMDVEEIGVDENFEELKFEIILSEDWEPHQGSAIESLVDRAKPSGVEHVTTRYELPTKETTSMVDVTTAEAAVTVDATSTSTSTIDTTIQDVLFWDTNSAWDDGNWS